ncbi:LIM domain transcription factor LMO4.2 [Blattella germanica]|nr:LIM domain transcription factor LMO4.2 [Blattella germanica]
MRRVFSLRYVGQPPAALILVIREILVTTQVSQRDPNPFPDLSANLRRLFGNSGACSACGQTIPASEFVMRAGSGPGPGGAQTAPQQQPPGGGGGGGHHVFHLKCFACSKCGAQLVPGDRYCLLAGSLVCEQDWHKLLKGSGVAGTGATTGTGVRKGKVGRPRRSRD